MAIDTSDNKNGISEAALFESISHETRIQILFLLRNNAMGFSELKRALRIKSSGNLQHHLGKLASMVESNEDGDYSLTDIGREAIMAINMIRNLQDRAKYNLRVSVLVATLAYYVIQLNLPFIMNTVDALTPISALVGTIVFGIIFYVVFDAMLKVMSEKRHVSDSIVNDTQ